MALASAISHMQLALGNLNLVLPLDMSIKTRFFGLHPIGSMYGIFTYCAFGCCMVNVGKYAILGSYANVKQ